MEYQMEELLPVVGRLAESFTSKESSSVTYETAQMLMEGVIYCVEACCETSGARLRSGARLSAEDAYRIGYEQIIQKVYQAKQVYTGLTANFTDYGCKNYRDTIMEGMPAFFLNYDVKFRPQNHILTLDYPAVRQYEGLCGVNLIYPYLCGIALEKQVLECFDEAAVQTLLKRTEAYHDIVYMDNLCSLVLLHAVGCMIAGTSGSGLELTSENIREIKKYFEGRSLKDTENRVSVYLRVIIEKAGLKEEAEYFRGLVCDISVRIHSAAAEHVLEGVFL